MNSNAKGRLQEWRRGVARRGRNRREKLRREREVDLLLRRKRQEQRWEMDGVSR